MFGSVFYKEGKSKTYADKIACIRFKLFLNFLYKSKFVLSYSEEFKDEETFLIWTNFCVITFPISIASIAHELSIPFVKNICPISVSRVY